MENFTNEELKLLESALWCLRKQLLADRDKYSEMRLSDMEALSMTTFDKVWDLFCKISNLTDKEDEEE